MAWAPPPPRDAIALVLAIGLATALNVIVLAILWDAIRDPANAGISENATQILTGWGGGIVGILGAVFGYRAGRDGVAGVGPGVGGRDDGGVDGSAMGGAPLANDGERPGPGVGAVAGGGGP